MQHDPLIKPFLEAIGGEQNLQAICHEYELSPREIRQWIQRRSKLKTEDRNLVEYIVFKHGRR